MIRAGRHPHNALYISLLSELTRKFCAILKVYTFGLAKETLIVFPNRTTHPGKKISPSQGHLF